MAMDSIIARPTNKVRVIVAEASGCWASEVRAVATALPFRQRRPHAPETGGDAGDDNGCHRDNSQAIHGSPLWLQFMIQCWHWFGLGFAESRGGRDVNRGQDAEDVGLHHAGEQTEQPSSRSGKMKGVMVSRMAMIIAPLIMLPNRRTARASVRESSLMILNGSMMNVGFA